jgi:hypothetical protein
MGYRPSSRAIGCLQLVLPDRGGYRHISKRFDEELSSNVWLSGHVFVLLQEVSNRISLVGPSERTRCMGLRLSRRRTEVRDSSGLNRSLPSV